MQSIKLGVRFKDLLKLEVQAHKMEQFFPSGYYASVSNPSRELTQPWCKPSP